jgi:transposase
VPSFSTPAPRTVTWWLLQHLRRKPPELTTDQQAFLTAFAHRCPAAARVQNLVQEFHPLLRQRRAEALDPWLQDARDAGIPELTSFVRGVARDKDAVVAACSQAWSNGQVEGQATRLKTLKRQMYGRAKFDLLRVRVLAAPASVCSVP